MFSTLRLAEFLQSRTGEFTRPRPNRQQIIEEWRAAIVELFDNIREWLTNSDPTGVLSMESTEFMLRDEGLSQYSVQRFEIHGLGNSVALTPKARYAMVPMSLADAGATGLGIVEMSDGGRKYNLYHIGGLGDPHWIIVDDDVYFAQPLTRESFEAALKSFLA